MVEKVLTKEIYFCSKDVRIEKFPFNGNTFYFETF